jgi:hypothetical protein
MTAALSLLPPICSRCRNDADRLGRRAGRMAKTAPWESFCDPCALAEAEAAAAWASSGIVWSERPLDWTPGAG